MLFLSQFGQAFGWSSEGSFFMYFIALFAAISLAVAAERIGCNAPGNAPEE